MSDIDFDELDRAVNGAIGGNNMPAANNTPAMTPRANEEAQTVPETPVAQEAPTVNLVERTTVTPLSSSASVVPTPPMASKAPAARRSSGRFMDMVHPSSDMRSQAPNTAFENRRERTPEVTPEATVAETTETPVWNEPLESPFLADAKVEKRPLGGGEVATTAETNVAVSNFDFQGLLDEPEEALLEAPEVQERIEATTTPDPIEFVATDSMPNEAELKSVEDEEPTGPTSIIPQYKEQPSSQQESGAMYDTESYHQAVAAPVKNKSGWLTVLLILLLVVVGAGGGWVVFTYILPML